MKDAVAAPVVVLVLVFITLSASYGFACGESNGVRVACTKTCAARNLPRSHYREDVGCVCAEAARWRRP